ncbi:NBR1-Ig-like domain-containing protein [Amycolatopsis vastitatis]|uniref:Transcriptional regulator n=1 Tax=Amycolatopsis vastitatis TaxID=1905142 RepID=A0A229SP66_9PSEU|nr:NBR1-Ig-like domain-containing protein [Amycolatopsis vastitatis]OXM60612.1 transcriptional regulator [Amycolatopsis vastitatis]
MTIDHAGGPVRKRGRRARRPDPDGGPVAEFAHALLVLKEAAGDPSYDRMRTEFGAVASKSALAAAARGLQLPSWETTWEFVRPLAVTVLGREEEETRREWRARWNAARQDGDGGGTAGPEGARHGWLLVAAVVVAVAAGVVVAVNVPRARSGGEPSLPIEGDASSLVADVTYPDGSRVAVNQRFVKTWRLRNAGTVAWHGRFLQRLPPLDGLDVCHTDPRVPLPDAGPGAEVTVSVPVQARGTPGPCQVFWKMVDSGGRFYLPQSSGIYFQVDVTG